MQGLEKFGKVMDVLIEDCNECPLERICDSECSIAWQEFLKSKVKEDGIELCRD